MNGVYTEMLVVEQSEKGRDFAARLHRLSDGAYGEKVAGFRALEKVQRWIPKGVRSYAKDSRGERKAIFLPDNAREGGSY